MTGHATTLRTLLDAPELLRAPGVFDGLSAHLVRRAGFRAAYLTGAGVAASGFGLPDIGLITQTEMVERVRVIAEACEIPLIADADTGYGTALHTVRTVRAYESAGVAAIQLEDQVFPKRCGHLQDKQVVDTEQFARTLTAALEARRGDTVVIARTDARGPLGLDEAIARAHRYAEVGADLIFVEAPESRAEITRIAAEIDAPLLFNVVPAGRSPEIGDDELERLGFRAAIYPGALLAPVAGAMAAALTAMGGTAAVTPGPAGLFGLVGLDEWQQLSERYRLEGALA
ncbi:isocitrate lyase/PEP mutase family protein [Pseudonocardia kujensis]|uniref:isocitrate lyase/PEP mutase family protein n=1 Tax=Pseudonocardia kujensis TaxID=1128675 RepID=UPI001E2A581A|nr:isocitrate lyase/PEP mutase family protein [Pseudonocardia kujensis]MCE0763698.1 isocitrate lyase/PEP mutase family protein [Pseudonocardia kujensis]